MKLKFFLVLAGWFASCLFVINQFVGEYTPTWQNAIAIGVVLAITALMVWIGKLMKDSEQKEKLERERDDLVDELQRKSQ